MVKKFKPILIEEVPIVSLKRHIVDYLNSLNFPVDDFFEETLQKSKSFQIKQSGTIIGYCLVTNDNKIVQFNLDRKYLSDSQNVFNWIIALIKPDYIVTLSFDKFLLNLCENNLTFVREKSYQFYFPKQKAVESVELSFDYCSFSEIEEMHDREDHYYKTFCNLKKRGEEVLKAMIDSEIIGFAVIVSSPLQRNIRSIGIYVIERNRGKGFGIKVTKSLCYRVQKAGFIPVAGCSYLNTISKNMLIEAGMIQSGVVREYKIN